MNKIQSLLDKMWTDYTTLNPQAQRIVNLMEGLGDEVENDHIALRTFSHPKVGLDVVAKPFLEAGYEHKGDYEFIEKKLRAKHYEHSDPKLPLIFISELLLDKFSDSFNTIVNSLVDQVSSEQISDFNFSELPSVIYLHFIPSLKLSCCSFFVLSLCFSTKSNNSLFD